MFVRENEPLAGHTTYHIGGRCAVMLFPETSTDFGQLKQVIDGLPCLVLGNGSNILFADTDLDIALVNLTLWRGMESHVSQGKTSWRIRSGTPIQEIVAWAGQNQVDGFDFLAGIPGTIGGAVGMNAGAWGRAIGPQVEEVALYSLATGSFRTLAKEQMHFGYRSQDFVSPGDMITEVVLDTSKPDPDSQKKIDLYLAERKQKHPPYPSCGSVFRNFPDVSAAKLIESCGLKGKRIGQAQISEQHANFIVNLGRATFQDVYDLIRFAQQEVQEKHSRRLEPEVKIIDTKASLLLYRIGET